MAGTAGTVRWGVLGTARIARDRAVPAIRALPEATLHAVASRDPERARAFAAEHGATVHYGDYRDLLADDQVDAVYLPLPKALHARWVREALTAGKPVLCEKPLCTDPQTAAELVELSETSGVPLAEGFMYRHHPTTTRIAELIDAGAIGVPLVARGALSFPLTDSSDIRTRPDLGGGALLDLGCYVVDALCRLYGGPAVAGGGVRLIGPTGVDEQVSAALRFAGDRIGVVDCSFRLPWLESVFEIRGTEGTLRAPHAFNPGRSATVLTLARPGGRTEDVASPACDMFAAMFGAFSRAVLGDGPYPFPARDSVASAQTLSLLAGAL